MTILDPIVSIFSVNLSLNPEKLRHFRKETLLLVIILVANVSRGWVNNKLHALEKTPTQGRPQGGTRGRTTCLIVKLVETPGTVFIK